MILTGSQILREMEKGNISISPFSKENLNPNSYNLTLSDRLLILEEPLDIRVKTAGRELIIPDEGIILQPNRVYLASTLEYTETKCFIPILYGRSSLSRLGLSIHSTGGFGDAGFKGSWTLAIHVVLPIRIYKGIGICQIVYNTVSGEIDRIYDGKYQNGKGIQESRLYREIE